MIGSGLFPIAREVMHDQSVAQQTVTSLPFRAFHNALRIRWSLDQHELEARGIGDTSDPSLHDRPDRLLRPRMRCRQSGDLDGGAEAAAGGVAGMTRLRSAFDLMDEKHRERSTLRAELLPQDAPCPDPNCDGRMQQWVGEPAPSDNRARPAMKCDACGWVQEPRP